MLQVVLTNRTFHFFENDEIHIFKDIRFKIDVRLFEKICVIFHFHVFYSAISYKGIRKICPLTLTWKPMQ